MLFYRRLVFMLPVMLFLIVLPLPLQVVLPSLMPLGRAAVLVLFSMPALLLVPIKQRDLLERFFSLIKPLLTLMITPLSLSLMRKSKPAWVLFLFRFSTQGITVSPMSRA